MKSPEWINKNVGAGFDVVKRTGKFTFDTGLQAPALFWKYVRFFTPLILTGLILLSYYMFFEIFLEGSGHFFLQAAGPGVDINMLLKDHARTQGDVGGTYASRIAWTTITNMHFLFSVAAVFACTVVLVRHLRGRSRKTGEAGQVADTLKAIGLFGVCTIIVYLASSNASYKSITVDILRLALSQELSQIINVMRWADGGSFAVAVFLAFTSAVLSLFLTDGHLFPMNEKEEENIILELLRTIRRQRILLFAGAAVLVTGILQLSASFNWALAAIHSEPASVTATLKEIMASLINSRAVYYTILLATIYVPGMLRVRRCAFELAEKKESLKTATAREQWLKDHGLLASSTGQIPRFAALLSPILTGVAAQLIKAIQG